MTGTTRRSFLAGVASLPLLASAPNALACGDRTIRIRKKYDLQNLDPADYVTDDEVITLAVLGSLVRKTADGKTREHLAASVSRVSDTRIRFTLLGNARWWDGKGAKDPVTARDVKYSFERIAGDKLKAKHRRCWAALDQVLVNDSTSGEIVLKRPAANLWDATLPLGCGCIVSEAAVEALSAKRFTTSPQRMAGRYLIADYQRGVQVDLLCNPDWKGRDQPAYKRVLFQIIPDDDIALGRLRSGEVDALEAPPDIIDRRAPDPATTVRVVRPALTIAYLGMNLKSSRLGDARVREAIGLALDVEAIIKRTYSSAAVPAAGPIPAALVGARRERPAPKPDPSRAKKALASAGFPNGFETTLHWGPDPYGRLDAMAAEIAKTLGGLGVNVKLVREHPLRVAPANVQLYLLRYAVQPDPAHALEPFRSNALPVSGFVSGDYDAALDRAETQVETASREKEYRTLQDLLDRSNAFVWLAQELTAWLHRKDVVLPVTPYGALGDLSELKSSK